MSKPNYREAVEAAMFEKIRGFSEAKLATLDSMMRRLDELRTVGEDMLPQSFTENPTGFVEGFFKAHSEVFVKMIEGYNKGKEVDGNQLFMEANLLSATSMYLAENLVQTVDFSNHPVFDKDKAEVTETTGNP